jgi:hypothetical protein
MIGRIRCLDYCHTNLIKEQEGWWWVLSDQMHLIEK